MASPPGRWLPPAPPAVPQLPVAPEEVGPAAGAEPAGLDLLHPRQLQPARIAALQVHLELLRAVGGDEGPGLRPHRGRQGLRHVGVGLEAAGADAGADGRQEVLGVRAVGGGHSLHRLFGDAQGGAPPAGVDRPHRLLDRVIEQDHDAVGGENEQGQAGDVGDQAVGVVVPLPPEALAGVGLRHEAHRVLVDLLTEDGPGHVQPHGGAEPVVVLLHVGRIVPGDGGIAQVHRGQMALADAPQAGGEAVAHPRPGQQGRCQEGDFLFGVLCKFHGTPPFHTEAPPGGRGLFGRYLPQQCLYFFPLPQGQGSLRPIFSTRRGWRLTVPSPPTPSVMPLATRSRLISVRAFTWKE